MMDYEIGRRMLGHFLRNIRAISDKEYQRRVWIRQEGPEWDDFTETVCDFFDMGEPVLEEYKICKITESQYQILKNFRDVFDWFSKVDNRPGYLPEEFIDSPEWTQITEQAKEVLKAFNYPLEPEPKFTRRMVLETCLRNIERLSDKVYQERVWVKHEDPVCEDIEEALYDYFEYGDWIQYPQEEREISQHQSELLLNLNKKARNFVDVFGVFTLEKSTEKLIHLPEWDEIVEMAKEVLKAFHYQKEKTSISAPPNIPPAQPE